ncbi:MAG: SsrA-binding protein SmpB [Alphaproteobacteria bacterium]|nr:SsrA-binding protein SmpB [Alphaproteobacteria bacterium]
MTADKKKEERMKARRSIALNRRARFDYHIADTFEAGIILTGTEVKSLRAGQASIEDAYAGDKGGQMHIFNMYVAPYGKAGDHLQHDARRPRPLLLHKREIGKLMGAVARDGMTLVPLALYFNKRGIAKVEIGLAKGKTKGDKRETIKQRDWQREKSRVMRERG